MIVGIMLAFAFCHIAISDSYHTRKSQCFVSLTYLKFKEKDGEVSEVTGSSKNFQTGTFQWTPIPKSVFSSYLNIGGI